MNVTKAKNIIETAFAKIVGQATAKQQCANILLGPLVEKGYMAPILLAAPAGTGKTKFLRAIKSVASALYPERKHLYFESGDDMGTPSVFWEDVLAPHVHEQESLMYVDELHKAGKATLDEIRKLVEITAKRETKFAKWRDYECAFNLTRNGIIVATNKVEMLDDAFLSRFTRIDLEYYTDGEMEEILHQVLEDEGIIFHENTLNAIAQCNRGTARDVIKWGDAIKLHLAIAGKKTVSKADVTDILHKQQTLPQGVTKNELKTLLVLEKWGEQQLQELAAKNGCSSKEQKANETYLWKCGFLSIDGKRRLSQEGREYLSTLRKGKFIPTV